MNIHSPAEEIVALRAEVAQFRLMANNVPVAIAYFERGGFTCRFANIGYASMFGRDEQSILGLTFAQIIGQQAADQIQPQVDRVLRERRSASYERQLPDPAGGTRFIEVNLVPHLGPHGEAVGAFVLISDITHHRRAEQALRESEDRLAKFLHASAEGIVFHKDGLITDVNPPLLALVGHTLADMRGLPALDFVAPDQRDRVAGVMAAAAELTYETAVLHADGTRLPVEFIVRTMLYNGERQRMTIVRDLRDRIEARSRIDFLAHHDPLTGLPNRASFIDQVETLIAGAMTQGTTLALLFIDLDHFKRVNDTLGHLAGDLLLQTVAKRIGAVLRSGDRVSRFGGDEFLVLLTGNTPPQAVQDVAHKLLAAVGAPVQIEAASVSVTPSIGIAMFPRDGTTTDTLLGHADIAMYHAKSRGRANARFYEPSMAEAGEAEVALEGRLSQALDSEEFVLHFQPQLSLADGSLVGCEALIRWMRPDDGLVNPDAFLPLAEARRLMLPIGHWVVRAALRQAKAWADAGLAAVPVAVNLSTLQFQAADFVDSVARVLAEEGCEGRLLELELTERMLMQDLEPLKRTLQRLKALGVRLTVDDFGTGFTPLRRLKELPVDRLKIDRSLVQAMAHDEGSEAVVAALLLLARKLGIHTVAGGVETAAQRERMQALGCEAVQGYLEARPMTAADFEAWLRGR